MIDEFLTVSLYQPNEFISRKYAALLEKCFSSSKTVRQHIVLVTESSFCTVRQFISPGVWPANRVALSPVDYRIAHVASVSSTSPRYG